MQFRFSIRRLIPSKGNNVAREEKDREEKLLLAI